jgi:integrase
MNSQLSCSFLTVNLTFSDRNGDVFWGPILVGNGIPLRFPNAWLLSDASAASRVSSATLDRRARALLRWAEYTHHHPPTTLPHDATDAFVHAETVSLFQGFQRKLMSGWPERGWAVQSLRSARNYGDSISQFASWLAALPGFENSPQPDPWVKSQPPHWTTVQARHEGDMLGHLYRATKMGRGEQMQRKSRSYKPRWSLGDQQHRARSANTADLANPEQRIGNRPSAMSIEDYQMLLASAYETKNWRNLCLWLLLGAGACRISEALNLFSSDVHFRTRPLIRGDADSSIPDAYVALANPVEGLVEVEDQQWMKRRDYLARRFGVMPRCLLPKNTTLYAGYKGMSFRGSADAELPEIQSWPTRGWALVEWLFPSFGRYFAIAWINYRNQLRAAGISEKARHPYLLVNIDHNAGGILTRRNVSSCIESACRQAGIRVRPPHSLRHMYGNTCADLGVPLGETQIRLRHESPLSTLVYYNASRAKMRSLLALADKAATAEAQQRMLAVERGLPKLF